MTRLFFIATVHLLICYPLLAEDVNLSTYYPAPFGSYPELRVEETSDAGIGTFTSGVTRAGLRIISTYTANNFTSGIFWTTSNNNANTPKAGIWMREDDDAATGSQLYFGTSNDYAVGITNTDMVLSHDGNLGLGTTTPTQRLHVTIEDAVTNTVTDALRINHSSSNTPADNFGTGLLLTGESSTTNNRNMARIQSVWTTAADATRTSSLQFQTVDNAGALTSQMTVSTSGLAVPVRIADPAVNDGAVYYNSNTNKFRVCEGGVWKDMVGAGGGGCNEVDLPQIYLTSVTLDLTIGGRNICEDENGCLVTGWINQSGYWTVYTRLLLFQDGSTPLTSTLANWQIPTANQNAYNGDTSSTFLEALSLRLFLTSTPAHFFDDTDGVETSKDMVTIKRLNDTYPFKITVCDNSF